MSAISLKSITGITSITTPTGVDNQLTLHNNNTTEAVKLDVAGNLHFHNHLNITGISTASNFKTGTSNLHSAGLNVAYVDVDDFVDVGSNIKLGNAGIITATGISGGTITGSTGTFSGDISITDKIVHTDDTNTAIRFPAADTVSIETAGSTRLHIHSDGRFRVGTTAQPSGTVSGFQLDMGSYPGTMRLMSGAGASATGESAGISVGGSNHHADLSNGNNYGANLNLYNYNSTDGNSSAVSFMNSNGLSGSRVVGNNASHSSRTGNLVFMTASGSSPTEKVRIDSSGRMMIGTTIEGNGNADEFTISYINHAGVSGGDQGRCGMTIRSGDNTSGVTQNGYIYFSDGTSGANESKGVVAYEHSTDSMYLSTNQVARLRIGSSGQLGIGGANYGTSGQVLTSQGSSSAPQWASPSGLTHVEQWHLTSNADCTANTDNVLPTNAGTWNNRTQATSHAGVRGTGMTYESNGIFRFPSTGIWKIDFYGYWGISGSDSERLLRSRIQTTVNNSSYSTVQEQAQSIKSDSTYTYQGWFQTFVFDVTSTSNCKCRFVLNPEGPNCYYKANANPPMTGSLFMRLGDT